MKRILVVDDEPGSRYSMARLLSSAGYEVTSASNYLAALEELGKHDVDLLLTDIMMPKGINGFALARMAQMRQREIKVLYVTAYDLPTDEALGKVLRKPISDRALLDNIVETLAA